MLQLKEKKERRLGERLFLKGERCLGPKCASVRRNYPPGPRATKHGRKSPSEFSDLARTKQKIRYLYRLDDKALERYTKTAAEQGGVFGKNFIQILERRLDNIVFRLGLALSRSHARQLVSHGNVLVNGRKVNIASYLVRVKDTIALKARVRKTDAAAMKPRRAPEPPQWLSADPQARTGTVTRLPDMEATELGADLAKIKEFYFR
ncbi:MAG: 30S ribosomal protein S4 [Patescibacteria group bacterium]